MATTTTPPADTDADGIPDAEELALRTDPRLEDTDFDGLPDGTERLLGTDPIEWDSDHDGRGDGTEIALRTDPQWREVRPRIDILDSARRPTPEDQDGDGLPFHVEQRLGTDPGDPDTDGDGLGDRVELLRHSDPLSPYSAERPDMTTDLDAVEAEIPALREAEAPTRVPPAITTEFGHRITFPDGAQSMVEPAPRRRSISSTTRPPSTPIRRHGSPTSPRTRSRRSTSTEDPLT